MHLAKGSGTQNGAQLGEKHGRVRQAPAYGAQAQGRVQVRGVVRAVVQRFVRAHVHRANGYRQAPHAFDRALVGLELLFFVGQMAASAHEQKLAAKQTHTQCAGLQGAVGVLRHLDIGQQLHFFAVKGDGWGVEKARQAPAFELQLAFFEPVLGQDDG